MKYIITSILLLLILVMGAAQVDSVCLDTRDGEKYQIVEIGEHIWFKENLRYKTIHSYCNRNKPRKHCDKGNYYTHFERDTVCPEGWRTASLEDWESYIEYLSLANENIDMRIDSLPDMYSISVKDVSKELDIFSKDKNLLELSADGWIEGRKWINLGTLTLWISIPENDSKYHIHVGNNKYIKHSHKHNIIDKKRKRRKFPVRCVCDKNESSS